MNTNHIVGRAVPHSDTFTYNIIIHNKLISGASISNLAQTQRQMNFGETLTIKQLHSIVNFICCVSVETSDSKFSIDNINIRKRNADDDDYEYIQVIKYYSGRV